MIRSEKEFDYIKIKLASPTRILQWSNRKLPNGQFVGEVQNSETVNYRTFKPEMDGLFCERIFGPSKSLECACGKYKQVRYKGLICELCGVELIQSRVRRHRMGHINLIYPVTHIWYVNSRPNYIALLLEVEQCEKRLDTGRKGFYDLVRRKIHKKADTDIRTNFPGHRSFPFFYYLTNIRPIRENNFIWRDPSKKYLKWDQKEIKLFNNRHEFFEERKKLPKKKIELLAVRKNYYGLHIKKGSSVNSRDERIKRLKIASIAYFIAQNETNFYKLHWDFQQYRRCRELGLTGYPKWPFEKLSNQRRNIPKYLLRATPNYLIGSVLIKRELEKLNLNREIIKTRIFITIVSKAMSKKKPFSNLLPRYKVWDYQRFYKLRYQSIKRVRILENLVTTGTHPTWMILTILPVIPPSLRPMIQLEGGRFATSDLNELYRRIIIRNNRLLRLLEIDAPQLIIRNEKRMLQEAIDTLIDNGRRGKIALSAINRPLKSLSDIIKGKHGRFRQNLLGKRVDYSGRSVIVVGPSLKLNQCGLPSEMAIELFQPFIIRELIHQGLASNMKVARNLLQKNEPLIDPVVDKVLSNHPIFLNRAPTLHRLGIQAFEPIIVQGRAIKLHPLVCSAFNADFDGDQMAVHVPLSLEAQAECYMLMLAPYNFLSPANGEPIIVPSQDMVLGCYYLTINNIPKLLGESHYFSDLNDVILAYNQDRIELHTSIWVRYKQQIPKPKNFIKKLKLKDESYIEYYQNIQIRKDKNNKIIVQYLQTTTGRVLLNYTIQTTLNLRL